MVQSLCAVTFGHDCGCCFRTVSVSHTLNFGPKSVESVCVCVWEMGRGRAGTEAGKHLKNDMTRNGAQTFSRSQMFHPLKMSGHQNHTKYLLFLSKMCLYV